MSIRIKIQRTDWEGKGCVGIHGPRTALLAHGFIQDSEGKNYLLLRSDSCIIGAHVKEIVDDFDDYLEIDPCLLTDLSVECGSSVLYKKVPAPSMASRVKVAISENTELNTEGLLRNCRSLLSWQMLSKGQVKPVHFLSGEKVFIKVMDVRPKDLSVFTPKTQLFIGKETISPVIRLEDIGGLEREKKQIKERILFPMTKPEFFSGHGIKPPRGILLCGPPGCGKTMIAKALSNEINANFVELVGNDMFEKYYGDSEQKIKRIFSQAREKTPSVILIDEIDCIGLSRSNLYGELEKRLVTSLLAEMDGLRDNKCDIIVVGTTNIPESLDPALLRPGRFDYVINIGVPDQHGRLDILTKLTRRITLNSVDLHDIARRTNGFVGADLMMLCREAAFAAITSRHSIEEMDDQLMMEPLELSSRDFEDSLKRVKPSALREFAVEVPTDLNWTDIGGLGQIKDTLIEEISRVIRDPEAFRSVGINPVKGVLLYGPPGTGKTLIARVVANEVDANFISVRGPEILTQWVGESEKKIRNVFSKARESSPCIVFFDEIDAISAARGKAFSDTADKVVNQLLTEMDGFETGKHVVVMAATNRIELIDQALLRPGRFDYHLMVPLPDEEGRAEIYNIHLSNKPLDEDIDVQILAELSGGFSGAHIAEVCRRAAMAAFRENNYKPGMTFIAMQNLLTAIDHVRTTITDIERPPIGFTR